MKPFRNALALALIALALAACGANVSGGNSQWIDGLWKQADNKGGGD